MNKSEMLRFVNPPLALSFLVQAGTGLIIFFGINLPDMKMVFEIHEYNGPLLTTLIVTHIVLNFSWIRETFFPVKKQSPARSS